MPLVHLVIGLALVTGFMLTAIPNVTLLIGAIVGALVALAARS